MRKNDSHNDKDPNEIRPGQSKLVKSTRSTRSAATRQANLVARANKDTLELIPVSTAARRTRKVKFADPLLEQRLYDRTASPNAETEIRPSNVKTDSSSIEQLKPPLTLVASLDLAAIKLDARPQNSSKARAATTSTQTTQNAQPFAIANKTTTVGSGTTDKKPSSKDRREIDNETPEEKDILSKTTKSTRSVTKTTSPSSVTKKEKKGKN